MATLKKLYTKVCSGSADKNDSSKAKSVQVKQVRAIIKKYKMEV